MSRRESGSMPRGVFIGLIVAGSAGVLALITVLVVVVIASLVPRPVVVAEPGDEIFEALRLTDADVASLGLEASESGHTPSLLSTAVGQHGSAWTSAKGAPEECAFAGGDPGSAVYPVWGDEDETTPLWTEPSVSATQSLSVEGFPFITLTSRVFDDEAGALDYLLDHNDRVTACPQYTSAIFQGQVTTTVTPLLVQSAGVSNTGWVAETADWIEAGAPADTVTDLQFWVLNLQRGPVVTRMTMLVPAEFEGQMGGLFTDLSSVVGGKLNEVVP